MKKLFLRLGITVMLTPEEFALVSTGNKAAHDLLRGKVEKNAFKLDGETYSPANFMPCNDEYYLKGINTIFLVPCLFLFQLLYGVALIFRTCQAKILLKTRFGFPV